MTLQLRQQLESLTLTRNVFKTLHISAFRNLIDNNSDYKITYQNLTPNRQYTYQFFSL